MLGSLVNKLLRKVGKEIKTVYNGFSLNNDLHWLQKYDFNTVIDIGANEGQFAVFINQLFPQADIYSFEPISECCEKIKDISSVNDKIKPFNLALGNSNEKMEIFKNEFTPSSSLLKMTSLHIDNFPFTKNQVKELIEIKRIDDIYPELKIGNNLLVKIDVQGYEMDVLNGGLNFFTELSPLIVVETSFESLYENEPSFHDVYTKLLSLGYSFRGFLDQLYSPKDGSILQGDAIFEKKI